MIKFGAVIETDGSGYWSNVSKEVRCKGFDIGYINDEKDFAELRVYFDTESWDVNEDGLIYTDRQFMLGLKEALAEASLDDSDVSYSEQGMQGDDYVSLDVGPNFINSLMEIAPEVFA